jgi:cell wall assembly regulator SMI1
MDIQEVWQRILAWHQLNAPRGKFRLARGASAKRIASLERLIEQPLPNDLRESYQLHDGTAGTWLLFYGEVMPLDGIGRMWERYREWQKTGYGIGPDWKTHAIQGPIKPIWWSTLRIPITDNGGGDPVMIDLDPAKGGRRGQVIAYNHEIGPKQVLARSFAGWLEKIANALEAGEYVYIEEAGTVAPPGMYG